MSETLIQMRELTKIFHRDSTEVVALKGIDLDVESGDFISLMGPSGSGKSTLLNIIAGIDRPTGGQLVVLGEDVTGSTEDDLAGWRNEHIGFVFQHFNLLPVLTAFENVELPLLLTPLAKKERREHVEAALKLVGLEDRMEHYPRQLSGGQEQRVAIARAIVTDPTFILADEPTGDLDAESAQEVLRVLSALNRDYGKTIIMVTHDPKAAAFAKTNHYLEKGVLQDQTPVGGKGMETSVAG